MRNAFDPDELTSHAFYRLLTALVVPRPIAWISTIGADGVDNLAPHSFFTIACVEPPIVQFSSVRRKDTLRNVEETGEFVVNFAGEEHFEAINATSTDFPRGVSEFDVLGIEREPSLRVGPPRVAGSPAVLECTLHSTVRLGDSTVVFGRVVHAAVDQKVLVNGHPEIDRLRPLARLGKDEWGTLDAVREIERVRYADWSGSPSS
ncbi:flavin reductase family protein [Streptomyces sp. NPDC006290]|uniref:flavin reductase family protein n=1 Tax=unclassified Streptomyces TaxID=2593676 RepID=UPI0033B9ED17